MKIVSSILALLFVGIITVSTSAQPAQDKDGGTPPPAASQDCFNTGACPNDMVEVEGDFCSNVEQKCLYNVDVDGKREDKPADDTWSCGEFQSPSVCKSDAKVHLHFCMDKYEWPNKPGQIPQDWMTWYDAKKAVESVGKRLCTHREWTLAAEGPDMHPVPYGDGFHRDNTICNFDRHYSDITNTPEFKALNLKGIDVFQSKSPNDAMSQALRMFLVPSGSKPDCVSDYGVHDMAGNIDEFVVNEGGAMECPPEMRKQGKCMQVSYISGLMGGHIWHVRNASRPMTTAHYPGFGWYETGTRACKDIQ